MQSLSKGTPGFCMNPEVKIPLPITPDIKYLSGPRADLGLGYFLFYDQLGLSGSPAPRNPTRLQYPVCLECMSGVLEPSFKNWPCWGPVTSGGERGESTFHLLGEHLQLLELWLSCPSTWLESQLLATSRIRAENALLP